MSVHSIPVIETEPTFPSLYTPPSPPGLSISIPHNPPFFVPPFNTQPNYDDPNDPIFVSPDLTPTIASSVNNATQAMRGPCELPMWKCRLEKAKADVERYIAENAQKEQEREIAGLQTAVNTLTARNAHLEEVNRQLEHVNNQHIRIGLALTVLADTIRTLRGPAAPLYFPPLPAPLSPVQYQSLELPPPSWPSPPPAAAGSPSSAHGYFVPGSPVNAYSTFSRLGAFDNLDTDSSDSEYPLSSDSEVSTDMDSEDEQLDVLVRRFGDEELADSDAEGEADPFIF